MVNTEENETLPKSANNGPRVSFNRDVHVKRYGSQLNHNDSLNHDSLTSRSQSPVNFRRELPADLSDEALEREAALVLEQANYFGSLPHRKNSHRKPIRRSISDASTKKSKRSSIFNIFNNTSASTNSPSPVNNKKVTNEKHATNKKVERSKSDVSSRSSQSGKREKSRKPIHLKSNSFNNNSSDSSDNNNSFLTSTPKKKVPLSPITEVNSPLSDVNTRTDYFDELLDKSTAEKSRLLTNGKGFASSEDLDLIPTSDKLSSKYSKSVEAMHSSQMPAEKPALTKGVALNRMIKRLSVETLSPPPQVIQAGGFSYHNPQLSPTSPLAYSPTKFKSLSPPLTKSDQPSNIVYAQVVNSNELKNVDGNKTITSKTTVHNTLKKNRQSASPPPNIKSNNFIEKSVDNVDNFVTKSTALSPPAKGVDYQFRNSVKITTDFDRDESNLVTDEEPIIKPNIRHQMPRYSSNSNLNHQLDNHHDFDNHHHHHHLNHNEMRDTDFNDLTLSNRRKILESRIKSRIGGLHVNNSNDNNNTFSLRTSSSPPTTAKRFHKYGSNEIINRYSPERNHLNLVHSPSPSNERSQSRNYADSTLLKKSNYYSKHNDKGDSGIEVDNVTRNNKKNSKHSSRFNIGRKWNYEDDIIECELFLMKEKKHTEETYPYQLVRTYVYRERSIDDGSHYDPNLDKVNIIKEWKHNKKITKDFLKSKKKKSGLEKVKELFKTKNKTNGVDDSEVRSRYREYSPNLDPPPSLQQQDIANRRRLSTPTASPVITNRSKSLPPKGKKLNGNVLPNTSTLKRDKENGSQKFNWFSSLERLSKKKSREPSNASSIDRKSSISRTKSTSLKNVSTSNGVGNKTLRFFGDTDRDEADSISKATSKKINGSQEARVKSLSLQNLNGQRKVKQTKSVSRSRSELENISESTSDTEFNKREDPIRRPPSPIISKHLPPPRPPKSSKLVTVVSTTLPRPPRRKMFDEDEVDHELSHRDALESMPYYQKKENFESDSLSNLTSARRLRESLSMSRENLHRERFDSDASQRSVVFLHATTVGDIPSQTLDRRRPSGKNSIKAAIKEEQPMMRTVNRSVSLSAPWKPKFISDGYEINYNNDVQKGKFHQNQLRSKSASREKSTERRRWDRDTPKRI